MTERMTDIMTDNINMDTHTNVMTVDNTNIMTDDEYTDTHTNTVMTSDNPVQRSIGKPKLDKDPNGLKIASFRTKEGVWADFCNKAEEQGLTATDVLKAAMEQFISGEYNPSVYTPVSTAVRHHDIGLSRHDVLEIVNIAVSTAISTLSIPNDESIEQLVKAEVEPLADLITELETYTQNQFKAVREDLKKPLALAIASPSENRMVEIPDAIATDSETVEPIEQPNETPSNNETPRGGDTSHTTLEPTNIGFKRVLDRLDREPELRARIASGLEQSLSLKELGQWLADRGFLNKKGEAHGIDACSQFKRAIEYLKAQPVA